MYDIEQLKMSSTCTHDSNAKFTIMLSMIMHKLL